MAGGPRRGIDPDVDWRCSGLDSRRRGTSLWPRRANFISCSCILATQYEPVERSRRACRRDCILSGHGCIDILAWIDNYAALP